jgi:ABC-type glycerol-3-phosphate transport system substrate-binding protein
MPEDIPNMVTFSPTIGLVKNGASPEIAEKAFDYALSEDWQQRVSGFGGKVASRPGVAEEGEIPPNAEYFPILDDVRKHQEFLEILRNRLN